MIYRGKIQEKIYGENDNALFIGDCEFPIADVLKETINGRQVSVRYWFSNVEKGDEILKESVLRNLIGVADADYEDQFSNMTGYLWTDEELIVGGHNLLEEIRSLKNSYILLEIDIH